MLFEEGKINTNAMNTLISYIDKIKNKVENEDITMKQALTYSNDFEQSLAEKNVFAHFESMSDKVKTVLNTLKSDTGKHIDIIKNLKQELSK